jgi:iron complex outermembrane receptor protein
MYKFFLIFLSFLSTIVYGQELRLDSTYSLPLISINSERYSSFTKFSVISIDTSILSNSQSLSVADILQKNSSFYIKTYGQGSLASISVRGALSNHTGIFWNGILLNTPNEGSIDLSLLPVSAFSSIDIREGGGSSIYGSGIIGGSIHLNNKPVFQQGLKLTLLSSYASFREFADNYKISYGTKKISISTSLQMKTAENNFPFYNKAEYGSPLKYQKNAALYNYGIMTNLAVKPDDRQIFNFDFWYQYSNRQIPSSMLSSESKAYQIDQATRYILSWKRYWDRNTFKTKIAFIDNYLNYVDELIYLDSKIKTKTIVTEIEDNYNLSEKTILNMGVNVSDDYSDITAYNGIRSRFQTGLFTSLVHNFALISWQGNLSLRQDFIQGYKVPLSPLIGFEGKIWRNLYIKGSMSGNFRVPTLNDRFWQPGGNSDLLPEQSINQEIGLILNNNILNKGHNYKISLTAFNYNINNQIIWLPETGNYWSPRNIGKVRNSGIESFINYKYSMNKFITSLILSYSYVNSINKTEKENYNKKMIYIPANKFSSYISIIYKNHSFYYNYTFNDKRYTTSDNSNFIPFYSLHSIGWSEKILLNRQTINLQFEVNNLANVSYQTIEWRPMPGRNYRLSIQLTI